MNEASIASADIADFISPANLLIRRYPATPWKSLYVPETDIDIENYCARITAVGVGPLGAKVAKLLSTNSYGIDCYEVLFDLTASKIIEVADLVTAVKESHLLFVISGFEDSYCDLVKAGIIDPVKVVRCALQDAASIAGLMITTEATIAELPKKEEPHAHHGGGMGDMGGMM